MDDLIDSTDLDKDRVAIIQNLSGLQKQMSPMGESLLSLLLSTTMTGVCEVSCGDYVKAYIRQNKIEVRPNGIFKNGNLVRNHRAMFYKLHQAFKQYRQAHKLRESFSREEVGLEFEAILEDQWDIKQRRLRERLTPYENATFDDFDEQLTELTTALTGHICAPTSMEFTRNKAFIAHFVWQVMTKIHYGPKAVLKSGNESMLLLVSHKQKTGKSTTVRFMLDVFDEPGFVWKANFDRLEDRFSYGNLAYNYVVWFDDADTTNKTNSGRFKQLVTDDEVSFRAMYTQTEMQLPKLATIIGTSNKTAQELINDVTGLRRFHQIMVNNESVDTGKGIDLDFISKFNFEHFYRSLPLNENTPLFLYLQPGDLQTYEEEMRPRHVTEMWLDEMGYVPGVEDQDKFIETRTLFESLQVYTSQAGYSKQYTPTQNSLSRTLKKFNYPYQRTGRRRGFWVKQKGD